MTRRQQTEQVIDGHRLGRHVNHDPRSRAYRYRGVQGLPLQTVMHLPTIGCLDQGDIGSCVANTGTELLATTGFEAVRPPVLDDPYAQALYHDLTAADTFPGTWPPTDTGSDGLTLGKVLVARGLASGYQHALNPAEFLAALQTQAVPVGITWRAGCDSPNTAGLIRWTGAVRGGHELLAVGYDADRQWVLLQNHWSARWGVAGRCWISVADVTAALADRGDATVIVPASRPAPVPEPPALDVDAQLWNDQQAWAAARHTGRNAAAAKRLTAWAKQKGFLS